MRKFINSTIVSVIALTVMLLLCSVTAFAARDYVLYVGDRQVTSDNASDIFGDGTAVYDEASSTLTLNNANIDSYHIFGENCSAAIYSEMSLNISVDGDSTIKNSLSNSGINYGIYVAGGSALNFKTTNESTLKIRTASGNQETYGIYVPGGNVLVDDTALKIYTGDSLSENYGVYAGTLSLKYDGDVYAYPGNVTSTSDAMSAGVYAENLYAYDNSNITVNSGTVTGNGNAVSIGCYIGNSCFFDVASYFVLNSGDAYADSSTGVARSCGLYCLADSADFFGNSKLISGAGKALAATSDSVGAYFEGTVSIRDFASINAECNDANRLCVGFYADEIDFIKASSDALPKGELFANFKYSYEEASIYGFAKSDSSNACGIMVVSPVEGMTAFDLKTYTELSYDTSKDTFLDENMENVSYVRLMAGVIEEPSSDYVLYIGDIRVTSENKSDILGDGSVSYDEENHRLCLNNANISGSHVYLEDSNGKYSATIYAEQSLEIYVSGVNTITSTADNSYDDSAIMLYGNVDNTPRDLLTIYADGRENVLNVFGADAEKTSNGICAKYSDFSINNVTVNSSAGIAPASSGIYTVTFNESGYIQSTNLRHYVLPVYDTGCLVINDACVNAYGDDCEFPATTVGLNVASLYTFGDTEINAYGGDITCAEGGITTGVIATKSLHFYDGTVAELYAGDINVLTDSETSAQGYCAGVFCFGSSMYVDSSDVSFYSGDVIGMDDGDSFACMGNLVGSYIQITGESNIYGEAGDAMGSSIGVVLLENCKIDPDCKVQGVSTNSVGAAMGVMAYSDVACKSVVDGMTGGSLTFDPNQMTYVNALGSPAANVKFNVTIDADVIFVGGVKITNENANDVFGDGTVSYDAETKTLTLNNANIEESLSIEGVGTAAIYAETPLVIKVVGTNTITSGSEGSYADAGIYYGGQDIEGAAAITIFGESTDDVLNVHTSDAVSATAAIASTSGNIIFKDVTVNAECGDSGCDSYGIAAGVNKLGNILVDGAIVNVESGDILASDAAEEGTSVGVVADDIDIINNGQLNVLGGDVNTLKGGTSIGINTFGDLNVLDGSSVNAEGGTVTETSGEATGNSTSAGIVSNGSLTVDGGSSVSGTGGETSGTSAGIYSAQTNIPDGTVTGSSVANDSMLAAGIVSGNDISDSKIYDVDSGEELTYNSAYSTYVDSNGVPSKNTTAVGGIIIGDYNLVVGHVLVYASNKDDIFGDLDGEGATAYYDPATNTLYLENANITTYFGDSDIVVGVGRYGSLNIKLIGENKITLSANEYNYDTVIGLAATGELNISSDENATLDVVVNTQASLIGAGIATIDISGEGKPLDITVSGKATVTARAGKVVYHSNAPSVGILSGGSLSVLDNASIYGYGGELVLADDGTHSGDVTVSAGVIASANLIVDTTGKVYGKGGDSDVMSAGVGAYGYTEVINGVIIGDVTGEMTHGGLAGGVAFINMPINAVAYTGASADELNVNTHWAFDSNIGLGTYVDDSYNIGLYTMILPGSGMNVLESSSTGTAGPGSVTVYVTGYDNVLVAFASYDENGRMIDMSYSHSSSADEFGKFTCDSLDMTGAVRVKSFMFENSSYNIVPLCEALESFVPVS